MNWKTRRQSHWTRPSRVILLPCVCVCPRPRCPLTYARVGDRLGMVGNACEADGPCNWQNVRTHARVAKVVVAPREAGPARNARQCQQLWWLSHRGTCQERSAVPAAFSLGFCPSRAGAGRSRADRAGLRADAGGAPARVEARWRGFLRQRASTRAAALTRPPRADAPRPAPAQKETYLGWTKKRNDHRVVA